MASKHFSVADKLPFKTHTFILKEKYRAGHIPNVNDSNHK